MAFIPAVKDDTNSHRELLPDGVFGKLTAHLADHGVTMAYAEQVMDQTIVFMVACAQIGEMLVPSRVVDLGLQAFVLHTREYGLFWDRLEVPLVHYSPLLVDAATGPELDRTLKALHATGYMVDDDFWVSHVTFWHHHPATSQ